jgi:hypothetical protein
MRKDPELERLFSASGTDKMNSNERESYLARHGACNMCWHWRIPECSIGRGGEYGEKCPNWDLHIAELSKPPCIVVDA